MRPVVLVVLALAVVATLPSALPAPSVVAQAPDFDLPTPGGARFFTQTNGGLGSTGYAVSNAGGIPFLAHFNANGGVAAFGYPVSHRFVYQGFVVQAFQKLVFQWQAATGSVAYLNVLDLMNQRGLDRTLEQRYAVPPQGAFPEEAGLPFDQVTQRRLALLQANPAIAAVYNSVPNPVAQFGLPTAPIRDMGGVIVLRAQRAVLQQWQTTTPWAAAGQVVIANGGDLGKELGLWPREAITPLPPEVAPLGVIAVATPTIAAVCNGDELMTITPAQSPIGSSVVITVTSARTSANVALQGPFEARAPTVAAGGRGVVWSWTVVPTAPGAHIFTFSIANVVCASGTLTAVPLVATTTPAPTTPTPTVTPSPTPSPTPRAYPSPYPPPGR